MTAVSGGRFTHVLLELLYCKPKSERDNKEGSSFSPEYLYSPTMIDSSLLTKFRKPRITEEILEEMLKETIQQAPGNFHLENGSFRCPGIYAASRLPVYYSYCLDNCCDPFTSSFPLTTTLLSAFALHVDRISSFASFFPVPSS